MRRRDFTIYLAGAWAAAAEPPRMMWADSSRLGRPYSKDPSVIRFGGRYLLYYSTPTTETGGQLRNWVIGIAESRDLYRWNKVAEIAPEQECERNGICAPCALLTGGKVHLFYQTYGNGRNDAICHAVSGDGIRFARDVSNPVFRPTGSWNAGRAIDAEVIAFQDRWLLYAATRDPGMKVQMIIGASASKDCDFGRQSWSQIGEGPLLHPELPWERDCIEAPTIIERGGSLYMFYAGGYNNAPQQIGCAHSTDGVLWKRLFTEPLLANGREGDWNSSESGHPCIFPGEKGRDYLFYQGNNDKGRTWFLSSVRIGWRGGMPFVMP